VEETPPSQPLKVGKSSKELFTNLTGANVGFQNWHPVAVTGKGDKLAGQAEMGGVWEWTSSPLTKHDGFEPMPLYPAYTGMLPTEIKACPSILTSLADFFDGKHNIVLGGSWATHPRIAGRKTL
jgi:formylglycine-generating enzyme required for sulfatase activity